MSTQKSQRLNPNNDQEKAPRRQKRQPGNFHDQTQQTESAKVRDSSARRRSKLLPPKIDSVADDMLLSE